MELKRILWEVNDPSEYIKPLFQEELNSESFVVEKQQYMIDLTLIYPIRCDYLKIRHIITLVYIKE
jgi:hypothetical protein